MDTMLRGRPLTNSTLCILAVFYLGYVFLVCKTIDVPTVIVASVPLFAKLANQLRDLNHLHTFRATVHSGRYSLYRV